MLGGLSMWELVLIFTVILLLFGAKRIPEIGASLGKGIREFKGSIREIENEIKYAPEPPKPHPQVGPESSSTPTAGTSAPDGETKDGGGEPRRLTTSQ